MASLSKTVLVVDDEAFLRLCARDVLEQAGFDVLEASDGEEALDVLSAHADIDAVVTDVRMPGPIDGLALAHVLRRSHPDVRSLVVSGHAIAADARAGDVDRFLPKPYSGEVLVTTLRSLLG
jgi:CheY-like chemotaxis protein